MKTLLIILAVTLTTFAQSKPKPTAIQPGEPFSREGEIIVDERFGKTERQIKGGVKYEIYYADASASILAKEGGDLASLEYNDKWHINCRRDAMDDRISCLANLYDLSISIVKRSSRPPLYVVMIGNNHYPGSRVAIRLDDDPPIISGPVQSFAFDNPNAILSRMSTAKTITTRYQKWPNQWNVDNKWNLYGFDVVMRYLKWAIDHIK